jgi:hypothetical protein
MAEFGKIADINPAFPETWQGKKFLTFDLDWAIDPVIDYTIDYLIDKKIQATFFITHFSPSVKKIIETSHFEIGIHPNFNYILDSSQSSNYKDAIDRILDITGPVKVARSHSLTQSSHIIEYFLQKGITHDCNLFIPSESQIDIKPWHHWNNIIRVPHFWEDDVNFISKKQIDPISIFSNDFLCVFDFHPIHVFLNTQSSQHYLEAKKDMHNLQHLKTQINTKTTGVRNFLFNLLVS